MSTVLKKSSPGKFAYTCHFQQIGINATKIEKTGLLFKTGFFAAVTVVDAKAAYWLDLGKLQLMVGSDELKSRLTPSHKLYYLHFRVILTESIAKSHVPNLTDDLGTAKERCLNQFGTAVLVWCGKSSTESVEILSNFT